MKTKCETLNLNNNSKTIARTVFDQLTIDVDAANTSNRNPNKVAVPRLPLGVTNIDKYAASTQPTTVMEMFSQLQSLYPPAQDTLINENPVTTNAHINSIVKENSKSNTLLNKLQKGGTGSSMNNRRPSFLKQLSLTDSIASADTDIALNNEETIELDNLRKHVSLILAQGYQPGAGRSTEGDKEGNEFINKVLMAEIIRQRKHIRELEDDVEQLNLEKFKLMTEKDSTPGSLLFFASFHDPNMIPTTQQLILQLDALKSLAEGSMHMEFTTLRRRLLVCVTAMKTLRNFVERYITMHKRWIYNRFRLFANKKAGTPSGELESSSLCPLCSNDISDMPANTQNVGSLLALLEDSPVQQVRLLILKLIPRIVSMFVHVLSEIRNILYNLISLRHAVVTYSCIFIYVSTNLGTMFAE